jgi:hypothetical protein
MIVNDVNLSVAFRRGQWPKFLKREGRRTSPEKRSCFFLCKNLIKREVRRFLYRQGARMTHSRRLHYSQGARCSQVSL